MPHGFMGPFFGFIIAGLVVVCGFILMFTRILRGPASSRRAPAAETDEAKMIQELYQGLSRMEQRIETLETLLLDSERKEGDR